MQLKVTEFFYSIQGETSYLGFPCIFVRLTGCNLRCRYCDTTYAFEGGRDYPLEEILAFIHSYKTKLVAITGGEPLLQKPVIPLTQQLLNEDYTVLVETNGSLPIKVLPSGVIRIVDIKCPGSGMSDYINWGNIAALKPEDEVKFVISNREDYEWAKKVVEQYRLLERCQVLFAPVFTQLDLRLLAEWLLADQIGIRLQPQLHKLIWGEKRGV
ncbi:MAG: radical SAM protein [Candidatus Desulfofervidaceae bacterium]|nr:radical SAM protein [Candidatus Desulfofervidaceae bacterium]MDL1970583.1 radical SAM protein [Candidatus Desulfofervidaceae bacterium]